MKSLHMTAIAGAVTAAAFLAPGLAEAASGVTTSSVNMRSGPGVNYSVVRTLPAGARVEVGRCSSWCRVTYHRSSGYVSASYIARAGFQQPRPPAPTRGYWHRPWWDSQHGAWYDGRRWYHNGRWYDRPNFSITFGFGG